MSRVLLVVILSLLMIGCSEKDSQLNQFSDYSFPTNQLKNGKVFTYHKIDTLEKIQVNVSKRLIDFKGREAIEIVTKSTEVRFDSVIANTQFPFATLEIYKFDYDTFNNYLGMRKGIIEKEKISNASFHSIVKYEKENIITRHDSKLEFIKDTCFQWNQESIPAVYFEHVFVFSMKHKYIPLLGKEAEFLGYSIYAKGLGLVQYGTIVDEVMSEFELKKIE